MRKKFFFLGILLGVCLASPAQFYSARTNLIGLATGNINLEGSMTLNRRWSLHLPVQYNPFVFKDNRQPDCHAGRALLVRGVLLQFFCRDEHPGKRLFDRQDMEQETL